MRLLQISVQRAICKWLMVALCVVVSNSSYADVTLRDGSSLSESPVRIVTYVEVVSKDVDKAEKLIRSYIQESQSAKGNLETQGLQRTNYDNHFVILETWASPVAYDEHTVTTHTLLFRNKLQAMLIAPMDIRRHAALTTAPEEVSSEDQSIVYVVTHMDVSPPQQFSPCSVAPNTEGPCANDLIKAFADSSRKHRGNIRFEVLTQNNRSNHMTVVEAWQSEATHTAHLEHSQTDAFRAALAGTVTVTDVEFDLKTKSSQDLMLGSLWDERVYRKIKP